MKARGPNLENKNARSARLREYEKITVNGSFVLFGSPRFGGLGMLLLPSRRALVRWFWYVCPRRLRAIC
jgi:hypothetical protein